MLDTTLSKLDGVSLCQRLRDVRRQNHSSLRNSALAVLMFTAGDTFADKIIGLDAGADD